MYENLTKNLTADEQQIVQAAVNQADIISQQETFDVHTNGHPTE